MLTLQELKRIVDVPGFEVKLPTAKQLRSSRSAIAQKRLGLDSEISAYQSGYALYQVGKHFTVFFYFTHAGIICIWQMERRLSCRNNFLKTGNGICGLCWKEKTG